MKRIWKGMLRGIGVFLLLVALAVVVERLRGEISLRRELDRMKKSGKTMSVGKLKPARPDPSSNTLTALLVLTNQLEQTREIYDHAPSSLKTPEPGIGVAVNDFDAWVQAPNRTNTWQQMDSTIELCRKVLPAIESAALRPAYDTGMDYESGFVDFKMLPLTDIKYCCNLLSVATLYDLKLQDLPTAHRELLALTRLAAKQTPEPIIISQLVRQACAAIAFNTTWQALQQDGWDDRQLATLQDAWDGMDLIGDMEAALVMERALTASFYRQVRRSPMKLDNVLQKQVRTEELIGDFMGKLPARGFALRHIYAPLWRTAWAAQDEAAALRQWNVIVKEARAAGAKGWKQPVDPRDNQELILPGWQPQTDKLNYYDRCRFLFSSFTAGGISPRVIRRTLEYQTQQQMVMAALALKRFELREKRRPEQLAGLVPTFLDAIPTDHMDKQPLRYKRVDAGGFVLYSVGRNAKDDLGDPRPEDASERYRMIWDGRDAVWPNRASKEQAQAAMLSF